MPFPSASLRALLRSRRILLATLVLFLALPALFTFFATRRAELDFPATGHFVVADSTTLHYLQRGEGPPIVFLHGAFGASQDFSATLFPKLSPRHQLFAFDRPGHGWSLRVASIVNTPAVQADCLHAAFQSLHLERPVLVGFSYGGSVALAYALRHPADLSALVLVNPVSHPWPGGPSSIYSIPGIPLLGPLFTHLVAPPLSRFLIASSCAHVFAPAAAPESFADISPLRLELAPARFAANCEDIRILSDFLAVQSLHYSEIRAPTLLLASIHDEVVTFPIHSQPLAQQIQGAELVSFADAGHQLPYIHPAEVARAIDDFLLRHGL